MEKLVNMSAQPNSLKEYTYQRINLAKKLARLDQMVRQTNWRPLLGEIWQFANLRNEAVALFNELVYVNMVGHLEEDYLNQSINAFAYLRPETLKHAIDTLETNQELLAQLWKLPYY